MLYKIIYWITMCESISETISGQILKNQEEEVQFPHVYANCIQTYPGKDSEFSSESEGSVFEAQPLENSGFKDCYKPNSSKIVCVDYPDVNEIDDEQEDYDNDPYYKVLRGNEGQNKKSTAFYVKVYQNPCYFVFFLVVLGALLILCAYGVIYRRYWVFYIIFFVCITGLGAYAIKKSFEKISENDDSDP